MGDSAFLSTLENLGLRLNQQCFLNMAIIYIVELDFVETIEWCLWHLCYVIHLSKNPK